MHKINFKLHYWPQLVTAWHILTMAISYIIAVETKSVHPFVPHISELGFWKPASCAFSLMLNVGALLTSILLYIRYKQIDCIDKLKVTKLHKIWNNIAFYLGVIFSIALSVVANFEGNPNGNLTIFMVHIMSAICFFVCGATYLIVQTIITFALQPYYDRYPNSAISKPVQYFRIFLTVCYFINFILLFVVTNAWREDQLHNNNGLYPKFFSPDTPGYGYHLASAIFEWILGISFFSYTLTMTKDFRAISFKGFIWKYE